MPAFVLLAVVGAFVVYRRRRAGEPSPSLALLRVPLVGAALGTAGVLTIAFIANRYLADVVPLVTLGALAGGWAGLERLRTARAPARVAAAVGVALLVCAGLWATAALTIVYQRQLRPGVTVAERASFISLQERIDASLSPGPPTDVRRVASLPAAGPPGSLAIVGDCAALYQSDGNGWDAVERSNAAGHFRLSVRLPAPGGAAWTARGAASNWPVLVSGSKGAAAYLVLRPVGPSSVEFAYLYQRPGAAFVTGDPVAVRPGSTVVIDTTMDPAVHEVTASIDGSVSFDLSYFVRPIPPEYLGRNPLGGPVAAAFPGPVAELPVATPICDALSRRLG